MEKKKDKQPDRKAIPVVTSGPEDRQAAVVATVTRPTTQSAMTLMNLAESEKLELDMGSLMAELSQQVAAVRKDDMGRPEEMLTAQAYTLDALFNTLTRRSLMNMGEHLEATEQYMRLALRAQAQSRSTLEALAEIKNPRNVAFVKQANVAHGPQQVNNYRNNDARGEKAKNPQNELLEHQNDERVDSGAPSAAVEDDSAVEAVAARYRP